MFHCVVLQPSQVTVKAVLQIVKQQRDDVRDGKRRVYREESAEEEGVDSSVFFRVGERVASGVGVAPSSNASEKRRYLRDASGKCRKKFD